MSGIYKDAFDYRATGNANAPAVLASVNIPGGSIVTDNAFRLDFNTLSYGDWGVEGSIKVNLNGKTLFDQQANGQNATMRVRMIVTRNGTSGGTAVTRLDLTSAGFIEPYQVTVSGLSWGGAQTLEIIGQSNQIGGMTLQGGGVPR